MGRMVDVRLKRSLGGGPQPEVPIERRRRRLRAFEGSAVVAPILVRPGVNAAHFADHAVLNHCYGGDQVGLEWTWMPICVVSPFARRRTQLSRSKTSCVSGFWQ